MKKLDILRLDRHLIAWAKILNKPLPRLALFVIYAWFGALKILNLSPANPLVTELLSHTMSFVSPEIFLLLLGGMEVLIGVLFLLPGYERFVIPLLAIHLLMTFLPLVLVPQMAWQTMLVPTLEGQYMIKNLLIIALAIDITANLKPMKK